jgi:DNA-binding transcriptional ArsR family regulator
MVANSSFTALEKTAGTLRAIAHPVRLAIAKLLHQKGELIVSEIHEHLGIEQAAASHHLKIMRFNHIVEHRKEGRFIYYSLCIEDYPYLQGIISHL